MSKYFPLAEFVKGAPHTSTLFIACAFSESNRNFTIGLYSPSDMDYRGSFRIPVNATGSYTVTKGNTSEPVTFDIIPISDVSRTIRGSGGFSTHELLIRPGVQAADLTLVKVSQSVAPVAKPETTTTSVGWNGGIENQKYLIQLDPKQVGLVMVTDKLDALSAWLGWLG